MSALTLSAKLERVDSSTPWGFRLQGGKDFSSPLTIQRVTPGSLAAKCGLELGDVIKKIGDLSCDNLKHKEAQQAIISASNSLELTLQRGGTAARPPPPSAVAPSYQPQQPYQPSVQSYNVAPRPFGAGAPPPEQKVPVVVNKQYNTPINLYSVNNVVDSLSSQTQAMSVHNPPPAAPSGTHQPPPWAQQQQRGPGVGPPPAKPAAAPQQNWGAPSSRPAVAAPTAKKPWTPPPRVPGTTRFGKKGDAQYRKSGDAGRVPVCTTCGQAIRGPFVVALDKTWCPDHFVCANTSCGAPLTDVGFVEENGQMYCEKDYERYFAPPCGKCKRSIVGECVNALNNTYHPHCFLCAHCRQPIGTGSFHMEDGQSYCEKDWQSLYQTKCVGCQFPIEPGDRWVEALGGNFHSECFNCSVCQVNLEGQGFYAKGGKPYCKRHA